MDYLIRADSFPIQGGEAVIQDARTRPGGSAANCALVLARLGVKAGLIARIGRDDPGREARAVLARYQVDTRLIEEDQGEPTGQVFVIITPDGERTMFSRRGANRRLSGQSLTPESFRGCAILHISGYTLMSPEGRQAAWKAVELARNEKVRITCDPGTAAAADEQARRALTALLPRMDILFPNQMELELLSGSLMHHPFPPENLAAQAGLLLQSGLKGVVVTLGEHGCRLITAREETHVPVDRENARHPGTREGAATVPSTRASRAREARAAAGPVNATGAGDAFAAGFLAAMLSGSSWQECARAGNRAGALAVSGKLF